MPINIKKKIHKTNHTTLSDIIETLRIAETSPSISDMPFLKVLILRNYTAELIEPYLRWHLLKRGINSKITFSGFATAHQEALSLSFDSADLIVLSLSLDTFEPDWEISSTSLRGTKSRLMTLIETVSKNSGTLTVLNTFLEPLNDPFGVEAPLIDNSWVTAIKNLNMAMQKQIKESFNDMVLIDWNQILCKLGADASLDSRMAFMTQCPFKPAFFNIYASMIARAAQSIHGKTKKCIILDCDNTLWGGIIGEDGPNGIKLDPHQYPGNCFRNFHKKILALQSRGILITLCSKNNEKEVLDLLDSHPHCLIKSNHLSGYRINWNNKIENIISLAKELNISLDSIVFVDDSPLECHLVSSALPEVAVIQVPDQLTKLPEILLEYGFFDQVGISQEDLRRSDMYREEASRREHARAYNDVSQYLQSLNIEALIKQAEKNDIHRIAQLTQKTNQFNLTTRRYTENQIRRFLDDPDIAIFTLGVRDVFGDSGLTGLLIAIRKGTHIEIDTLLLSCRVLGRELEKEFVSSIITHLRHIWNPQTWEAVYIPTAKNEQTADFWKIFGFIEHKQKNKIKFFNNDHELTLQSAQHITVNTNLIK